MTKVSTFRLGRITTRRLNELAALYGDNKTAALRVAIDRMYQQEVSSMDDQVIRSYRQGNAISDADLWDQFCGDMTPAEMLALYEGPDELEVPGMGWTATSEIAAYVEQRLWNYATSD
jgi:hypothetical protein